MNFAIRLFTLLVAVIWSCSCNQSDEETASRPGRKNAQATPGSIKSRPLPRRVAIPAGGKLFETLTAEQTGIDFVLHWEDPERFLKEFIFLNPAGGICAGDYDSDGLPDIYVTSPSGGNRLYRNLGDFRFEDTSEIAGVADPDFWGTGASFVDIDNDGDLDLYACGYTRANKLYINGGNGKFTERAREFGLDYNGGSMMMSFADIDNDGDLDGYLATTAVAPPPGTKFRVNFVARQSDGVEVPEVVPELREYWEILLMPNDKARRVEAAQYDHLFRNDGGRFVDVSKSAGIDGAYFTLSATWFDYDSDGDADLYVSNDYSGPDKLYRNRGDGTFEDVIGDAVPHTPWFSMGSDVGDLDNDGNIDLIAADMSASSHYREKIMMGSMDDMGWFLEWAQPRQYMRNALYMNTGTGRFREAAFLAGLASTDWSWTPRIEDFDQDGHSDVYITNGVIRDSMHSDLSAYSEKHFKPGTPEYNRFWLGKPMRKEKNLAFKGHGDLNFSPVGALWGLHHQGVSFGAATADFDADGDPDLIVSNADRPVSLYRNQGSENHRIAIELIGRTSNRNGLGAIVRIETRKDTQSRVITSARGWLSASDTTALFGLGAEERVRRLEVLWPGGARQVFTDLEADRSYTVTEAVGQDQVTPPRDTRPLFEEASSLAQAKHEEVPFDDFALQALLPGKLSQLGPGSAWGDIDGDGDDDFFLGGSRGKSGQLFRNEEGGKFAPHAGGDLGSDSLAEDLGAVFLDTDGDGDLDLYVARGGNEDPADDPSYRDRLFLNDGTGKFSFAPAGTLPGLSSSSGPVATADFDRDGDLDLFVGGRTVPGQYPLAPPSRLLVNTGGRFIPAGIGELPGGPELGMVTSALWSDADNDGWVDLLLTVEWGAVRFLRNESGKLVDKTEAALLNLRNGWWQGIAGGDVDGDGDIDYLVTNHGLNSKYKASPEKPEIIFYGDLDGSGKPHIVEAKLEGARILPRRGFSCSKNAMPSLGVKIGTFHNFASSALGDLYTENRLANALRLEANTLETGMLINDGSAKFDWRPLPRIAQIAPGFGVVLEDMDADGDLDAVIAQNSFSPQRETGRLDGGLGQMLINDGSGNFSMIAPAASGIEIPGDAKSLTVADVDQNGRPDLIFGMNSAATITYLNQGTAKTLAVTLAPGAGNPVIAGTRMQIGSEVRECYAGGGYLSQSGSTLYFSISAQARTAKVRWPDGSSSQYPIAENTECLRLTRP